MPNFNHIAGIYDNLKKIVFGHEIERATNYFLRDLDVDIKILIVGGGTGRMLENFHDSHQITYLELSESMISKAKKVDSKATVIFDHDDVLNWYSNEKFDVILTPFLLDCFNEKQLKAVFRNFKSLLNRKGKWIQTDFYPKSAWQKYLVKLMYVFFYLLANLQIKKLADFDMIFKEHGFKCHRKASFFHSMIESKIYHHIE